MNLPLLAVLVALLVPLVASTPARADSRIGLSVDGLSWSRHLETPLFDTERRWVPGDRETASFYVRNQAESGALLNVTVRSADEDALLHVGDISLHARAAGGAWHPLTNQERSHVLTISTLGAGDALQVDLRAAFDPASTNQSQRSAVALDFEVTLREARAGADGPPEELPGTGLRELRGWIFLAAALLGTGVALLRRSRAAVT